MSKSLVSMVVMTVLLGVAFAPAPVEGAYISSATVDVQIRDVLILSNLTGVVGTPGTLLQGAWGSSSITDDGANLLNSRGGPSEFGNGTGTVSYTTNAGAERNSGSSGIDSDSSSYPNQAAFGANGVASPTGIFGTSGALIANAEVPGGLGGDFFAHGNAAITNAFAASVLADVSSTISNQSLATANSLNGTINLGLASAATIMGLGRLDTPGTGADESVTQAGTSIFNLEIYVDTLTALIDLVTNGPGSLARGEFSLSVSVTGRNAANSVVLISPTATFASTLVEGGGNSLSFDFGSFGPQTDGGSGVAVPFLSVAVDANVVRSLSLNFTLTTTAEASATAVPEPTSMALFGLGVLGVGGYRIRRRQKNLVD